MLKKIAIVVFAGGLVLAGAGVVMYVVNATPVAPAISASEASNPTRPFVVKLHSQWCPVCLVTTSVWSQIEQEYSGRVFEESGSTGVVLVVDGRTKDVTASIAGSRDVAEYRAAIDAVLNRAPGR